MKSSLSACMVAAIALNLYVWFACFTFVLFPWPGPYLLWWNIPHFITICTLGIVVLRFCASVLKD